MATLDDIKLYINVKMARTSEPDPMDPDSCKTTRKLYVSGLDEEGNHISGFTEFCPTFWIPPRYNNNNYLWAKLVKSTGSSNYKELYGQTLNSITFKSIDAAHSFLKINSEMESRTLDIEDETDEYVDEEAKEIRIEVPDRNIRMPPENGSGLQYELQYICEKFPGDLKCNIKQFRIFLYDIETEVGHQGLNALPSTIVKIRNVVDQSKSILDGVDEIVEQEVTLAEVETKYKHLNYEYFDDRKGKWVTYNEHPYRYEGGFPEPDEAKEKLTLITIKDILNKHVYTWGLDFDFETDRPDVTYYRFNTEYEMLDHFTKWFSGNFPDILCGFNSLPFDNPYIVIRVARVLGVEATARLNPLGLVLVKKCKERKFKNGKWLSPGDIEPKNGYYGWFKRRNIRGGDAMRLECEIPGIVCLDYLKLYMKWGISSGRESYKLDSIGEDEVGAKKVENPTGGSFKDFYTGKFDVLEKPSEDDNEIRKLGYIRTSLKRKLVDNPHNTKAKELYDKVDKAIIKKCQQKFVEYNIQDVELVEKIEKKCKLFDICTTIAYKAKENISDAFSPTKTWDSIIYNTLWKQNIIIPRKGDNKKHGQYPGAYVKNLIGKYEFCESYDLDSLYPHIIMGWNIGPDTMVYNPDILRESGKRVALKVYKSESMVGEEAEEFKERLINKELNTDFAHDRNLSLAASGCLFKHNHQGILAYLCETTYSDRKKHKKKYLAIKSEHQKIVEELSKRGIEIASE